MKKEHVMLNPDISISEHTLDSQILLNLRRKSFDVPHMLVYLGVLDMLDDLQVLDNFAFSDVLDKLGDLDAHAVLDVPDKLDFPDIFAVDNLGKRRKNMYSCSQRYLVYSFKLKCYNCDMILLTCSF